MSSSQNVEGATQQATPNLNWIPQMTKSGTSGNNYLRTPLSVLMTHFLKRPFPDFQKHSSVSQLQLVPVIAAKICFEFVGWGCFLKMNDYFCVLAYSCADVWDFHTQGLSACSWGGIAFYKSISCNSTLFT